jgi:hypothetical protein
MARRDPFLIAVVILAAALRLYGIDHGLPFVYNPDEANIMARSLSVARGLDPGYYLYPSFFFYFLFAAMGGLFVFGRLAGRYEDLASFQARFFEDPTDFYVTGRLVEVFLSLATIVLTYQLAAKHFGRRAARASALFVAIAYVHVRDTHYLKHDVPAAFLVILALWAIDRAMERRTAGSYVLAGVVMGVGFATHYYLIFLAPAFVLCHLTHRQLEGSGEVLAAGVASAVTFFLLSPYVVLKLPVALDHMRANRQVVIDRSLASGTTFFPSLRLYVDFLLTQAFGYLLSGLVVLGLLLLVRTGPRRLSLWLGFPALFLGFVSYTFFAGRYLNPVVPSLAVAAGVAIAAIEKRVGGAAAVGLAALACAQPLYSDLQVDRLFAGDDTRTLAREWILAHIPSGAPVALQSYSVPLPQSAESFRQSLARNDGLSELDRRGKYAYLLGVAEEQPISYPLCFFGKGDELNRIYLDYAEVAKDLTPLRKLGVETVVLRYHPTEPPVEVLELFQRVREEGTLLHVVSPGASPYLDNEDWPVSAAIEHKGPEIEIWSLRSR